MDDGYPTLLNQLHQVIAVLVAPGARQHQPGTFEQRPEKLPYRHIEGK